MGRSRYYPRTSRAKLLVLNHLCPCGHGDLEKYHPSHKLWMELKQPLDRQELMRDPFNVIHPIDTQKESAPRELARELVDACVDRGRLESASEPLGIDADREGVDAYRMALDGAVGDRTIPVEVARLECHLGAHQVCARVEKVARVFVDVEADQVGGEEPLDELFAEGERAEDLERRPRRVQEPANLSKTKNTFVQSLSKCRTPTFAICPKFNTFIRGDLSLSIARRSIRW